MSSNSSLYNVECDPGFDSRVYPKKILQFSVRKFSPLQSLEIGRLTTSVPKKARKAVDPDLVPLHLYHSSVLSAYKAYGKDSALARSDTHLCGAL